MTIVYNESQLTDCGNAKRSKTANMTECRPWYSPRRYYWNDTKCNIFRLRNTTSDLIISGYILLVNILWKNATCLEFFQSLDVEYATAMIFDSVNRQYNRSIFYQGLEVAFLMSSWNEICIILLVDFGGWELLMSLAWVQCLQLSTKQFS